MRISIDIKKQGLQQGLNCRVSELFLRLQGPIYLLTKVAPPWLGPTDTRSLKFWTSRLVKTHSKLGMMMHAGCFYTDMKHTSDVLKSTSFPTERRIYRCQKKCFYDPADIDVKVQVRFVPEH